MRRICLVRTTGAHNAAFVVVQFFIFWLVYFCLTFPHRECVCVCWMCVSTVCKKHIKNMLKTERNETKLNQSKPQHNFQFVSFWTVLLLVFVALARDLVSDIGMRWRMIFEVNYLMKSPSWSTFDMKSTSPMQMSVSPIEVAAESTSDGTTKKNPRNNTNKTDKNDKKIAWSLSGLRNEYVHCTFFSKTEKKSTRKKLSFDECWRPFHGKLEKMRLFSWRRTANFSSTVLFCRTHQIPLSRLHEEKYQRKREGRVCAWAQERRSEV